MIADDNIGVMDRQVAHVGSIRPPLDSLPFKRLVIIARYRESVGWAFELPDGWTLRIFDKSGEPPPTHVATSPWRRFLGNYPGREAHTYLHAIVDAYDSIGQFDEWVFCQGNPFDHDPNFLLHLADPTRCHFGPVLPCPSSGLPHMDDAHLDDYCRVFGLPVQPEYLFIAGAQFRVTGQQIRRHPRAFYESLLALTMLENRSAYSLERLWPTIFQLTLP